MECKELVYGWMDECMAMMTRMTTTATTTCVFPENSIRTNVTKRILARLYPSCIAGWTSAHSHIIAGLVFGRCLQHSLSDNIHFTR